KDKDVLLGFAQSRLSLYEYRGRRGFFSRPGKGQVRVRDAITGKDFDVTERRQMHGLEIGDLFEARLVPLGRTFHFSTSFTYHPREVNRQIRREIKRRKKKGRSEEHTSELQSPDHLVCRLLLEKKKAGKHLPREHSERHDEGTL